MSFEDLAPVYGRYLHALVDQNSNAGYGLNIGSGVDSCDGRVLHKG